MDFDELNKPIYQQLAEEIEDYILKGIFKEESKIPSTTEYSTNYRINPATVRKAFGILVDEDIIYKKRGIGMFIKEGSREKIKKKRKDQFFINYIQKTLEEGEKLGISSLDIIELIKERGNYGKK